METSKVELRLYRSGDIAEHRLPYPIVVNLREDGGVDFGMQIRAEVDTHFRPDLLLILLLKQVSITVYRDTKDYRFQTLVKPDNLTVDKWLATEVFEKIRSLSQ